MAMLNYKFRAYPTEEQELFFRKSMAVLKKGWNHMVRLQREAGHMVEVGKIGTLRQRYLELVGGKTFTGAKAVQRNKLMEGGLSQAEAECVVNEKLLDKAKAMHPSMLKVEYAILMAEKSKKAGVGGWLGSSFCCLTRRYKDAWEACFKGLRGAPKKKRKGLPSIQMPLSGDLSLERVLDQTSPLNGHGDNYVNLPSLLLDRVKREPRICKVRFLQHREFPSETKLKTVTLVENGGEWFVVFSIEVPESVSRLEFPATGLSCGIDPGRKTALTLAGEDVAIVGQDGCEYTPGRPYRKSLKKLAKLQRRLDRQTRANNPECFDAEGKWIKGRRIHAVSKNMQDTRQAVRDLHAHIANYRKDYYTKVSSDILDKYDTVYMGQWKDATPEAKGKRKGERKAKFEATGETRKKGAAAAEKAANTADRDNAIGVFRQTLAEKAKRSSSPKQFYLVNERNTTRSCPHCGALTGPTGVKGLAVRGEWVCTECGGLQVRDRGAAWNILRVGVQHPEMCDDQLVEKSPRGGKKGGGQPLKGGVKPAVARAPKGEGAKSSGTGRDGREAPDPDASASASESYVGGKVMVREIASGGAVAETAESLENLKNLGAAVLGSGTTVLGVAVGTC